MMYSSTQSVVKEIIALGFSNDYWYCGAMLGFIASHLFSVFVRSSFLSEVGVYEKWPGSLGAQLVTNGDDLAVAFILTAGQTPIFSS